MPPASRQPSAFPAFPRKPILQFAVAPRRVEPCPEETDREEAVLGTGVPLEGSDYVSAEVVRCSLPPCPERAGKGEMAFGTGVSTGHREAAEVG